MQTTTQPAAETADLAATDLGPLAWVLDELRKSLDGATKALRRFVRDAELARGSDLAQLDASQLRIARQQLHQAVGALEMVGLGAPAKVLRAMEALAQKFVQRPELCSDDAANKVERASFALTEFLEGVLKGRQISPVALFPQYRDVMDLVGGERVHPADLWPKEWRWVDPDVGRAALPLAYGPAVRSRVDQAVLRVVRAGDPLAAKVMAQISVGLAAASSQLEPRVFWKISAAFFEAVSKGLCPLDVYVKRTASRVVAQYTTLARGEPGVIDRLAQDLLFYCAQAIPQQAADVPTLVAVRQAFGLVQTRPFDYETPQFGRFDPAVLLQARKRIATAAETWAALAGGDTGRFRAASDQFAAVAESMLKLHPESGDLARALTRTVEAAVRGGEPPTASVAMEVATSVLYLEAAYDDLDPTETQMAQRSTRLAQRLDHVSGGAQPEPLEPWMEELYRRVSDRQTMGSVVDELRTKLAQVESSLDQFFRNPHNPVPLHEVPSQLAQMRGVFSVLGLDQASLAALRMRDSVEKFLVDQIDDRAVGSGLFEKIGNSLGAMGFLIDMLSYQRALAKKLFVYDEDLGELRPVMGRETSAAPEVAAPAPEEAAPQVEATPAAPAAPEPVAAVAAAAVAAPPAPPPAPAPAPAAAAVAAAAPALDDEDAEMREIFLEEAREVVQTGTQAVAALQTAPADLGEQTTLRRAFHTLKGSSRMVGLQEFGEAAWAMEQLLNTWLADQKPASEDLRTLCQDAMAQLGSWVEDIAHSADTPWSAQPFRKAADALRLDNRRVPLVAPGAAPVESAPVPLLPEVAQPVHEPVSQDDVETRAPDEAAEAAAEHDGLLVESQAEALETSPPFELPEFELPDLTGAAAQGETPTPALEQAARGKPEFDATQMFEPSQLTREAQREESPQTVLRDFDATQMVEPLPAGKDEVAPESEGLRLDEIDFEFGGASHEPSAVPPAAERPSAPPPDSSGLQDEEPIKVIGHLRIGIPLYNVYLNEADEWSRRLSTELSEWALELDQPLRDSTIALAHSLCGSSGTVGFAAVAELARMLEQALAHVQLHGMGSPENAGLFNASAEEIRRLLHQFAAGFLKDADPALIPALQAVIATPPTAPAVVPETTAEAASADAAAFVAGSGAAAAPLIAAADEQSDAVDALDADLFPVFEEEAAELFPKLGASLRQWAEHTDDRAARIEALRVLHTLKGSARLAGAMRLGDMTHRMESAIEALGSESFQTSQIEPMLARFDHLQSMFDGLRAFVQRAQGEAVAADDAAGPAVVDVAAAPAVPERRTRGRAAAAGAPVRSATSQSVRVPAQLLDRLVNQAGEVIITRSRMDARVGQMRNSLQDLSGNLERLREQLREIEMQSESQMQARQAQTKDHAQNFDPLEFDRFTRVQELTRIMAESVSDVATVQRTLQRTMQGAEDDLIAQARQARELQRDLLRTRMVEFESISERLYAVVRQAAKDSGKQVKLDIEGGSLNLDRGVLERMAPAFEHMLRNAVAHGVESAERREQAGKPATGTITIALQQEGNDVSVTFSDDGGGLDLQRIREKAIANGLIDASQELDDNATGDLVFTPGFSTADAVTELSGRGIGLDVVRSEVNAIGGRIETSSEAGKGTRFKIVVPLTTAVTQVVMLRLGTLSVGVPANLVEIVRRVPADEIERSYASNLFTHAGEQVPFYWAGALLQASGHSTDPVHRHRPVLVFRSAGRRVAAHVDEVLGNQEVVVKNLGPQLARVPGLTGMSVLASGAVVLIYNPVALATVYGSQALQMQLASRQAKTPLAAAAGQAAPAQPAAAQAQAAGQTPLVMVVDDSITVRRVTQRLLLREGYRVVLANDGLQALERLQDERPAVVLSDIEMPRMDGFDLARNIRGDEQMRNLPIIMITSRIAEKHREHARELGVDHYLGKPYSEEELLGLIRHYCAVPADAEPLV